MPDKLHRASYTVLYRRSLCGAHISQRSKPCGDEHKERSRVATVRTCGVRHSGTDDSVDRASRACRLFRRFPVVEVRFPEETFLLMELPQLRTRKISNKLPRAGETTYVICRQVRRFADENLCERHIERVLVRILGRAHRLDERLARLFAFRAVVMAAV